MQKNYTPDVGDAVIAQGFFNYPVPAITAGTPLAEVVVDMQGRNVGCGVAEIDLIVSGAGVTASDTNFATITVSKRTNGGAPVTLATATTKTSGSGGLGNITAFVPTKIPLSGSPVVSAADVVTVTVAHTGSGVSIPASQLVGFQVAA